MSVFVGSGTNIKSDRIGFAVSTTNPGTVEEGDAYFNQTSNALNVYDGSAWNAVGGGAGGNFEAVASGSLSDGSTVVVNADGTVGIVTLSSASGGNSVEFDSNLSTSTPVPVYDSTNQKVVVMYYNAASDGSSSSGRAVVGTVSGNSITFGSPVSFTSNSAIDFSLAYDSTNQKVVAIYRDYDNSNYGTAVVGTVSGNSISFGSPVVFVSSSFNISSAVYDSTNQKVVIAYSDSGSSAAGTAVVGTVSGTSISFGSPVVFDGGSIYDTVIAFDSTNNKVVISYRNSTLGYAIVGTVSGTSISFGSPSSSFGTASGIDNNSIAYDSANNKVVITYRDAGNNSYGTAIVGTVSGTSITFGTTVVFNSGDTRLTSAVYNSDNGTVMISYKDAGNNNYGTTIAGTVSGTSINFDSPVVFEPAGSYTYISSTFDSTNNKVVIIFNPSTKGSAVVFSPLSTNLTASNFAGFSDGAYTNGQTATVQIAGSVDDAQVGLTTGQKYFVQTDGTLSTSAGSPSVEAGTAVSASKIIIKG